MIDHSFYFERYERVLEDLSKEQQNVFLCCDWLGMSHTETSKTLGLALGSRQKLFKAGEGVIRFTRGGHRMKSRGFYALSLEAMLLFCAQL